MTNQRDELTDEERRALLSLVHWEIEHRSERIRMLKRIRLRLRRAAAKAKREVEKPQR
jgi:hypothetical protein